MKLFDLDWQDFLDRLAAWQRLSLEARRTFAQLRPDEGGPRVSGGPARLLADNGFVEIDQKRQLIRLAKPCHHFGRAIRAMVRHDILSHSDADAMLKYLQDNFTTAELARMAPHLQYRYGIERILLPEVMSVRWVEAFLSKTPIPTGNARLENEKMPGWLKLHAPNHEPPVDQNVAKQLVRHLMELPGPVPFTELPSRWADVPTPALGAAILQGIEQLVLFPTMQQNDMTPMLGLWPTICQRLHRPKPKPPKPIEPQAVFHGAFLVEDMTTVLVAATSQPLRLRGNDAALFAKAEREIEANLMSVPPWVLKVIECPFAGRTPVAMEWLQILGLARRAGVPGDDLRLEPTHKGERWLAESAKGRLKAILDHLLSPAKGPQPFSRSAQANGDDWDNLDDFDDCNPYYRTLEFLPSTLPVSNREKCGEGLRTAVASAMTSLPADAFVPLAEFLGWQARESNPLPTLSAEAHGPMIYTGWSHRPTTIEEMETSGAIS
jgi:hypothetical protein